MPNPQEFTELLQPNLVALNGFVFGMVGNQFDTDDIVQETAARQLSISVAAAKARYYRALRRLSRRPLGRTSKVPAAA